MKPLIVTQARHLTVSRGHDRLGWTWGDGILVSVAALHVAGLLYLAYRLLTT